MPRESVLVYFPKRLWEIVRTYTTWTVFLLRLLFVWLRVHLDKDKKQYRDLATIPVEDKLEESLEMFEVTEAARNTVANAKAKLNKLTEHRSKTDVTLN